MEIVTYIFIGVTALLHIVFFKIESIDFMKTKTLKAFSLNEKSGEIVKPWAFNQGFYNLFLALGLIYSIYLLYSGLVEQGKVLAGFILLAITGAGVVLGLSSPKKRAAAAIQAGPALLAFIFLQLM